MCIESNKYLSAFFPFFYASSSLSYSIKEVYRFRYDFGGSAVFFPFLRVFHFICVLQYIFLFLWDYEANLTFTLEFLNNYVAEACTGDKE